MERMRLKRDRNVPARMGGIHRRYRREIVTGLSCDITDGKRFFGGKIRDVSASGFRVSHITDGFKWDAFYYYSVISGEGRHFKVLAVPRWRRTAENGLEIGFKLIDAPWEWTEFVLETVPQEDNVSL